MSVAHTGQAPYKSVVTHGFIKDEHGRKMSKSLGNVIDPKEIVDKYGADILRLWVSSIDFFDNIRVGKNIIQQQVEVYKKIRNTLRFLLGNLSDFTKNDLVEFDKLLPLDKWALGRLQEVISQVTEHYEKYEFSKVYSLINRYCTVELSATYLDILKDRLYVEAKDSIYRRSAQTVMFYILDALIKMLAPVLVFTTEEAYQLSPLKEFETVHLEYWPQVRKEFVDEKLMEEFKILFMVRDDVLKALENARKNDIIGHSLDAKVTLNGVNEQINNVLVKYKDYLEEIFIVSQVEIGEGKVKGEFANVSVEKASGEKCQRCWKYSEETGKDEEYPNTCPRCAAVLKGERK
jgi:isoleucyl-tRNA synthetase